MKYIGVLISVVLFAPIMFKEPAANGQSKEPVIVTPTLELKEARILSIENDKRSLAINNEIAVATNKTIPNNKLRSEILKYKRMAYALKRENVYYKRKITTLKKVLKKNYSTEPETEKYLTDSIIFKTDTLYLPTPTPKPKPRKKGFFKNIFN